MYPVLTLNNLDVGNRGIVDSLCVTGSMRRRMQELGLVEGTEVECLQKGPFGDPAAYFIRGTVIAIRKEDARGILIRNRETNREYLKNHEGGRRIGQS